MRPMFHVYLHLDPAILGLLNKIYDQGAVIMAKIDDIKAILTDIGNDINEIDGDIQEVLDKLSAGTANGLSADETTEVLNLLAAVKTRTRAAADKVPEPPPTPPTPGPIP